jgi:hypothetical protein
MFPDTVYCPMTTNLGIVSSWILCFLSKSYLKKQSWDEGINETSCNVIIWFYGMTPYSLVLGTSITNKKKIIPLCSGQKEVKLKNWFLSVLEQYNRLHGVIIHKIGIVTTEVKTSSLCNYLKLIIPNGRREVLTKRGAQIRAADRPVH